MRLLVIGALFIAMTVPGLSRSAPIALPRAGNLLQQKIAPHHMMRHVKPDANMKLVANPFDPYNTHLVSTLWVKGIGCPTNAQVVYYPSNPQTYTDAACPTGDNKDHSNYGLLLAKTGPTANFAAGEADFTNVTGLSLTELGYDLRSGSHCGAGSPRFDVLTSGSPSTDHFVGCASPPPTVLLSSQGWQRLRWDPSQAFPPINPSDTVTAISIIFDEGQDTGPDYSGSAIIDNVDINGTLVGSPKG